jgi:carboxyl-terminal processing protease
MRKLSLLFAGALMGASAMSLVYGTPGSAANAAGSETYKQLAIFGDIFERVRAQYVTPPDDKSLVENAINGMLASLDPHSSYMNAEQAQDMRVQTKGEFGGLGIEVTMENDLVKVITPIDDTPAAKAGVLAGDYIAKIDGEEVRGLTLNDAVEKMRGLVNTPIKLTILRQGADKPIELTERQAQGLCARSAPQSGWSARPGGERVRCLPQPWRDRLDARPRSEGRHPLRRQAKAG